MRLHNYLQSIHPLTLRFLSAGYRLNFTKIAEGCGAKGIRVKTREEFDRAFDEALKEDGPVVLDCIIGCDDKVWPMVAPGESISNIMENEEDVKK